MLKKKNYTKKKFFPQCHKIKFILNVSLDETSSTIFILYNEKEIEFTLKTSL